MDSSTESKPLAESLSNNLISTTQDNDAKKSYKTKVAIITIIILLIVPFLVFLLLLLLLVGFGDNDITHINPPLIIEPKSSHLYTIIYLHGLDATPEKFKDFFKDNVKINEYDHTRIVLLHADNNYVTVEGKNSTSWFDIIHNPMKSKDDYNYTDIKYSGKYVESIIHEEAERLGNNYTRILLGGHSQGAIVSLYTSYSMKENVGMVIANSGFLVPELEITHDNKKDLLVFAGHGGGDQAILPIFANETYKRLEKYEGFKFHYYEHMGHNIGDDEIKDMKEFIDKNW